MTMIEELDDSDEFWCEDCGQEIGYESHYHCGRCHDPEPTSMMGHGRTFDDGSFGLICEPESQGKTCGGHLVTEDDLRPERPDDD